MKRIQYILLCLMACLLPLTTWAQATGIPYSCSFEESEDLSNWVMNYGTPSATDKWMVGTAAHSEGKRALYISSDGKNTYYGNKPNVVVSYLRYKFPDSPNQKNYDISFDWKGIGNPTDSRLYVMVCPEPMLTNSGTYYYLDHIVSSTSGLIANNVVNNACQQLGESKERFLCGQEQWTNVSLSNEVRVSGANSQYTFAIVFIWVNNNRDENVLQTGICIDNLQIGSAAYKKPQNMNVVPACEDSTLLVSWESGAPLTWEIHYRKVGTDTWRVLDGLNDNAYGFERKDGIYCSYKIQRVPEGAYDVRVRGIAAAGDMTNFVYKNNVLVYCPDNHCINYIDFYGPNVECTYGYHPNSQSQPGISPYAYKGVIDLGPDSEESHHTLHVDPTETDPRTDDELFTVPRGALASVRLGNWKATGEADAITYNFTVDPINQGVLIVKYAVVVEYSGHDRIGEPFFRLEVLDENDNLIDESCGHADYAYSDAVESGDLKGWHISKSNSNIAWKEWTNVGVNLQPYAGQNIKVRITTSDCYQTAHFGYAYFTVDCASAYIETENCGNDARITCQAPDGFSYLWTDETGQEISTNQTLDVDAGMHTYTCRLSFIEDPNCFFEVSTISAPRFPVPEYSFTHSPRNCVNYVQFYDKSHVMNKYEGYERHTDEACQDQLWTFTRYSDGVTTQTTNPNAVYTARAEGDTILVRLTAYIGEYNACDSTLDSIIIVPGIIERDSTQYLTLCQDEPFFFDNRWYSAQKNDTLAVTYPNFAGCDSTHTLYLTVNPKTPEEFRKDSICSDSLIVIGTDTFNTTGHYSVFLTNIYGCDSIITTDLWVNRRLDMNLDHEGRFIVCADNGTLDIDYTIMEGQFDTARIIFSPAAKAAGFADMYITDPTITTLSIPYPATTIPGHYSAVLDFIQTCCKNTSYNIPFDVNYASTVVEQKWNDVLTVLSPQYNGGYDFISFQWYKNGKPIQGATSSYLYEPLDTAAYYHVVLTRADSVAAETCPIVPVVRNAVTKFPTLAKTSQQIAAKLQSKSQIRFVTATGMTYYRETFEAGNILITAPATSGVYVVEITPEDGERTAQQLIVQ